MAAIATALLQPNLNSRGRDGCFPLTLSPKLAVPCFSGDAGDFNIIRYRKARLQLARDSSIRGTTRNTEQNTKDENRALVTAQDSADNPKSVKEGGQDDLASIQTNKNVEKNPVSPSSANSSVENNETDGGLFSGDAALKGTIFAGLLLVGLIGGFGAVSYIYREQINEFLIEFSDFIEGYGAAGYALFVAVYAGLEILAIPAIPLTMSAGLLFGTFTGTILVSISGTIAATAAFLIARYLARDRILKLAKGNKKFLAIDKAIGENGFRVVALLRLSPLLPFSLGNYLYGLTSVKLVPYVLGSWLGMLPGTWAYVSAGAVGRAIIQQEAENGLTGGPEQFLTLGLGLIFTVLAATYVTRLAKDAVKDIE